MSPSKHYDSIFNMSRPSKIARPRTAFAEWLIEARRRRGWSQTALAEAADVSSAAISKIEAGGAFSRTMAHRLAGAVAPEGADDQARRVLLQTGLRAAYDVEIEREPFLDQIREAGVIEDLPPETQEEILDYIRFKAGQEQERRAKK